jgi:hypothetical protein
MVDCCVRRLSAFWDDTCSHRFGASHGNGGFIARSSIAVRLKGKPVAHVKLTIYRGRQKRPRLVLTTDGHGQAILPMLPPGNYFIHAIGKPDLEGDLDLVISSQPASKPSRILIALEHVVPPPTYEQKIASYEQLPIETRVSEFRGVVVDSAGNPIFGTLIDVVLKGTQGKKHVAKCGAHSLGRFSAPLENGDYLAFFYTPGFVERVLPLTISKTEGEGELRVKLQIGPATE